MTRILETYLQGSVLISKLIFSQSLPRFSHGLLYQNMLTVHGIRARVPSDRAPPGLATAHADLPWLELRKKNSHGVFEIQPDEIGSTRLFSPSCTNQAQVPETHSSPC
jgi:hypothetical protein